MAGAVSLSSSSCIFCQIASKATPTALLHSDEKVVAFQDINPSAFRHYLVIPLEHIPTAKDLQRRTKDYYLVSHMLDIGKTLLSRDAPQSSHYRFGFHQPPLNSVNHLHLHCLALPYTPRWRCMKYLGLGSVGFIEADKLLEKIKPPELIRSERKHSEYEVNPRWMNEFIQNDLRTINRQVTLSIGQRDYRNKLRLQLSISRDLQGELGDEGDITITLVIGRVVNEEHEKDLQSRIAIFFGCLMLKNGGDEDGLGDGPGATLGNHQQQRFEVVYDLQKRRVGCARSWCALLWDSLNPN